MLVQILSSHSSISAYVMKNSYMANIFLPSEHRFPVKPDGQSHVLGATHIPGSMQSAHTADVHRCTLYICILLTCALRYTSFIARAAFFHRVIEYTRTHFRYCTIPCPGDVF